MQKRRERIERWRAERKKKEQEAMKKDNQKTNATPSAKKWSLEDDSEDEDKIEKGEKEENGNKDEDKPIEEKIEVEEKNEEIDSLDEYMRGKFIYLFYMIYIICNCIYISFV